ncbi:ABC transporter permease [Sporosarcina sp. PTS2304]|uniref:ABC transporter permease n=1 Tax=Sporosarcina sp. PTS2304 TaxID=2283194 RepID=UPI000E0DC440|nr:ABC transporter permease [Sporosarcina sp. PTS2304]AXH99897.1 ABC transporter permease [Sporosarcina sp. PTS2304]
MREFWIIFKQSFITKAKTKSFFITTFIMVAGIFLFANLSTIIQSASNLIGDSEEEIVAVVDGSGKLADQLEEQLNNSREDIVIERSTESVEQLKKRVEEEQITAFLEVNIDETNTIHAIYTTSSLVDQYVPSALQDALQAIQTEVNADQLSLTTEQVATLFTSVQFEKQNISDSAKSEDELNSARVLVYVLMFVIYFAVIIYSSMIATEVATEKSSRVMEILISSVSPVKHMFAKVLGIGSLGIVQIMIYGVAGLLAYKLSSVSEENDLSAFFSLKNLEMSTLVYAVVFFLLGYFLYATLAALLGSLVSRTEDVQQMIMPMSLLIVAAFIIAATGLGNPELGYLKIASFIPFFTPLVMFLRVGLLDLPLWEPLLSIGILIVTIGILGWFGAKVYRGGVLMYGPSRSLKDIKKAIRLGKE